MSTQPALFPTPRPARPSHRPLRWVYVLEQWQPARWPGGLRQERRLIRWERQNAVRRALWEAEAWMWNYDLLEALTSPFVRCRHRSELRRDLRETQGLSLRLPAGRLP